MYVLITSSDLLIQRISM